MKKYTIRAVKYLVAFCVLYMIMMWVMHHFNNPFNITFEQRLRMMFDKDWQGVKMVVAIILLAVTYPFFGYTKRRVSGNIVTDLEQINRAADFTGLSLVGSKNNELIYRTKGLRRLVLLFEDEIKVRQEGDEIVIEGLRRVAVRMALDTERYITNKRRVE